jgi:TolB-like protein
MRVPPRTVLLALALAAPAFAHDETQQFITTGTELQEWCRVESEAEFVARNQKAYNWTARHLERGNTLVVEGNWRVDGARQDVTCQVARGAQREHATLRITPAS